MARYRKVSVRIWNDEKFRDLSDDGKLVFLFLITHPHMTSLGAMRATPEGLASELGWPPERFSEGYRQPLSKGMVEYDPEACCLVLPNFIKHNVPENPNVVKSWASLQDLIPECQLKDALIQRVRNFLDEYGEGYAKAFREAFPIPFGKGMAYRMAKPEPEPEPEQEQEHEEEETTLSGSLAAGAAPVDAPPDTPSTNHAAETTRVIAHYLTLHPQARPGKRDRKLIGARLEEGWTAEKLCAAINGYHRSPFHLGDNDRGRKFLNLDLVCRDSAHVQAGIEMPLHPTRTGCKPMDQAREAIQGFLAADPGGPRDPGRKAGVQ